MSHLGLFAKFWTPGTVKTRLAASIGANRACAVYQCCLFHLLEQLKSTATHRSVAFTPASHRDHFRRAIDSSWSLIVQSEGNLGTRMESFFRNHFDNSKNDPAIIIGADCPLLNADIIQFAFEQLQVNDVVIGPSVDGGYYLIGMRDHCFDIFDDITWSTPQVFTETEKRLQQANCKYKVLEPMFDVDEHDTLMQLMDELTTSNHDSLIELRKELLNVISMDSNAPQTATKN